MRLEFLLSTSLAGSCPSFYRTDDGRVVVQGDRLTDAQARRDLKHVLPGEDAVVLDQGLSDLILRAVGEAAG